MDNQNNFGNQNDFLIAKIIKRDGILFCKPHIRMKPLRGRKTDIDSIFIRILEIIDFLDLNSLAAYTHFIGKKILL